MTSLPALLGLNLLVVLGIMVVLWLASLRTGDPSFIDAWWPLGFVLVAWLSLAASPGDPARQAALVGLTTIWGVRLGAYLFWRWRRTGPDKRYQAMIRRASGNRQWFTLRTIFLLQGALMWVISLPLQVGQWYSQPTGLQPLGMVGIVIVIVGIAFESIGDLQLTRFKANPANAGQVLETGLWRYTRHPNYFGDACVWWGLFCIAAVNPVTALTVVSPLVMTVLLAKYSGVGPLEAGLRRNKPDYADYVARTSAFLPRPPR